MGGNVWNWASLTSCGSGGLWICGGRIFAPVHETHITRRKLTGALPFWENSAMSALDPQTPSLPASAGGDFSPWRMSVAPMMDWTDRHCRFFHRLLSRHALLYTEMVTTGALVHGDVARHLDITVSAVEKHIAKALMFLQEWMEPDA